MLRRLLPMIALLMLAAIPATPAHASGRLKIEVRETRYGKVLTDGDGRALYVFTADRGRRSVCYSDCAAAWPVAYTSGRPRAGSGAHRSLIGTTRRRDGRRQATYRGRPVYYYVGDRGAAQVNCQNVVEFGGRWLVVRASGAAVRGS